MFRTQITPPTPTSQEQLWNTKFHEPSFNRHQSTASSASLNLTLSMQPMEVLPAVFIDETPRKENTLDVPESSLPRGVPALVEYSSQETNTSASSSKWGTTQISSVDGGKKVSLYTVASTRLRLQTDPANISCVNESNIAEPLQSPPKLTRSLSDLSTMPVRGGDTIRQYESDSDEEESVIRFAEPIDVRHLEHCSVKNSRRVSEARSEALEKYRGKLTTRLDSIMCDFDSKINSLISQAKSDFASLRQDVHSRRSSQRSSRRSSTHD